MLSFQVAHGIGLAEEPEGRAGGNGVRSEHADTMFGWPKDEGKLVCFQHRYPHNRTTLPNRG
jgi:hypothetical protein